MPGSVTTFCPGHISGYFKPVLGDGPRNTGSLGAGMVIDEGVRVAVEESDQTEVIVEREDRSGRVLERCLGSPPLEDLLVRMEVTAKVRTLCRLPIGSGFGLSAAALTASAVAVNLLYDLRHSREDCVEFAHECEILHHTGLGDVAACQGGGRDCRKGAGIHAEIERCFDLAEPVFAVTFCSLPSPSILASGEFLGRIEKAFPGECPKTPEDFFLLSRDFSERSGLVTQQVREGLSACDRRGVPASMTMLGNGIFAYGNRSEEILKRFGETFELHLATSGVRIVGEP